MDENMQALCKDYGVDIYDLMRKVTQTANHDIDTGQTITVMLTVAEQRVLRAALEIAGEL